MTGIKSDIIAQLKRDIRPLQGFRNTLFNTAVDSGLGIIKQAFPGHTFPTGAVHEFIAGGIEDTAASCGFITGIVAALMKNSGAAIWISNNKNIFPPALKAFNIPPDRIIFIELKKEKEILWVMEEALKCTGLAAVIGEVAELGFTASRRLQLAVEESRVTGFILRRNPKNINTTACVTRWNITAASSELKDNMPGVGFPRWNVELVKVRNGKPGKWQLEFAAGNFRHISKIIVIPQEKRKTG
jgi:protein ImuA